MQKSVGNPVTAVHCIFLSTVTLDCHPDLTLTFVLLQYPHIILSFLGVIDAVPRVLFALLVQMASLIAMWSLCVPNDI
jgi:hypothetical protein